MSSENNNKKICLPQANWFSIRITPIDEKITEDDIKEWINIWATEWWFQMERGDTAGKLHFQITAYVKTKTRNTNLAKKIWNTWEKGIVIESANVSALSADRSTNIQRYVTKKETRVKGPWSSKKMYLGADLACMDNPRPFQKQILDELKIKADDRKIVWYTNETGNIGKSKLTKYLAYNKLAKCIKVTGADRLSSAICKSGIWEAYLVDIPRSIDPQKSLKAICEVIESLKNGHVIDNMYDSDEELFMDSPHVYVFSNWPPPKANFSADRWDIREI